LPTTAPTAAPSTSPTLAPSVSQQPTESQQPSLAPTPVYEFENQRLRLQNGQCILSRGVESNENGSGNETSRLLQRDSECNQMWASYVQTAITGEVIRIVPQYETLDVEVGNMTRDVNVETNLLTIFFDAEVAIRSPLREHFLNRYVAGPFDSGTEQEDLIRYLQGTGCPEFESLTGVRFVLPSPRAAGIDDGSTSTDAGLIAGLVAALSAGAILIGVFVFVRGRRGTSSLELAEQNVDGTPNTRESAEYVSEVGVHTNQDVSTLGDPIPRGASSGAAAEGQGDASTDSYSLDYDYQKAYMQTDRSTVSGRSTSVEDMSQLLADDDTLNQQYQSVDMTVEFDAPPGVLGLVLETNADGIPVVHSIKPSSVLSGEVQIGDRLLSVDGHDVSVMLASDVSKLIASKKDQPSRRFVFKRSEKEFFR